MIETFVCHAQLLWLAKSEPEPFLQPRLNHDGNVATKHRGDLRESDNYLRQPDFGADEAEVPELYGRAGADNVSHWGQAKLLLFFLSSRQVPVDYNAFGMDITIVNIFFGESTVRGDTTTQIP